MLTLSTVFLRSGIEISNGFPAIPNQSCTTMEPMEEPLKHDQGMASRVDRDRFAYVEAVVMVTLGPFMIFTTICCLFLFVFYHISWLVWFSVIVLGIFSIAILRLSVQIQNARARRKAFLRMLSMSCSFAIIMSTSFGWYIYATRSSLAYALESRRAYVNVRPEEPAEAHSDASWLFFSEDAHVDQDLSMGYMDGGTTYCVAPVLGDHDLEEVQYWAVGEECCNPRGGFQCDDAADASVRSGLVILNASPLHSKLGVYKNAVEEAEAAFGFKPKKASEPLLLRWVTDPEAVQRNYQRQAVDITLLACAFYFVASMFNGLGLFILLKRIGLKA